MKKQLLLLSLFALVAVSCSDDDGLTPAQQISKVYRSPELTMIYQGEIVSDRTVQLITDDLLQAEIRFNYLIPGESPLIVQGVALQPVSGEIGTYFFSEKVTDKDREIHFSGTVGERMSVEVTYKSLSPVIGSWKATGFGVNVTPSSPDATINMHGLFHYYDDIPIVSEDKISMETLLSDLGMFAFKSLLELHLNLQEDGNLTASWDSEILPIETGQTQPGMVRYNVYSNRVYAAIALEELLGGLLGDLLGGLLSSDSDSDSDILSQIPSGIIEELYKLIQIVYLGLPMQLDFPTENSMKVSFKKPEMMPYAIYVTALLGQLAQNLDTGLMGAIFGITGESLSGFLGELTPVMLFSPEFELYFTFERN